MLIHIIEYSVVVNVIWVFTRLFPFIYTITGGGPGYETTTVDYMIYLKAFGTNSQFGYASAISVLLLVLVMVITWVEIRVANRADDWS
jgi:multiple sugar transport system permease protein